MSNSGTLYVIGTDIGNEKYLSPIVKESLENCEWILCEHVKRSMQILKYFSINKKQISFNRRNEKIRTDEVLYRLLKGENLGLLSDAGMPVVSDPGTDLIDLCLKNNIKVKIISGTSSIIHAIASSGFINIPFYFGGFLIPSNGRRNQGLDFSKLNLKEIYKLNKKKEPHHLINEYIDKTIGACLERKNLSLFFVNGGHLDLILDKAENILPINTRIAICSELTKENERIFRGSARELKSVFQKNPNFKLGEHVILFYIQPNI